MAKDQRPTVVTCKVRLSYPHLFEMVKTDNGRMQYDGVFILPKPHTISDPVYKAEVESTLKELQRVAGECAIAEYGQNIPAGLISPIKDGDGKRPSDGQDYDETLRGCWFFSASSGEKFAPSVVLNETDALKNGNWKRAEPKDVYAGCYVRVAVSPYSWEFKAKKGISFNLITVQKLEDGEPLGYTARPESFFGSPAAAAGASHAGAATPDSIFGR